MPGVQPDEENARLAYPWPPGSAFPQSLEAITPEFMTVALRKAGAIPGEAAVSSVSSRKNDSQGNGSYMAVLDLEYSSASVGPRHLLAKVVPLAGEGLMPVEAARMGFAFERSFYTEIPASVVPRPRCYFVEGDLLIMERVEGQVLPELPCIEDMNRVLRHLASMHAAMWGGHSSRGGPHEAGATVMYRTDLRPHLVPSMSKSIDDIVKTLPQHHADTEGLLRVICARGPELYDKVWYPPSDPTTTLIYGDIKSDNILKETATGHLRFVDYAGIGWGPCIDDVAFFIVLSLKPDESYNDHWEGLLRHYHSALQEAGVSHYDWARCRAGYINKVPCLVMLLLAQIAPTVAARMGTPQAETAEGQKAAAKYYAILECVLGALKSHGVTEASLST